jgi:hypothetical protein
VRRKTDARRNRTESIERDRDILWKTFAMSSQRRYTALRDGKNPGEYGVVRLIHSQAATRHGGSAEFCQRQLRACDRLRGIAARQPNATPWTEFEGMVHSKTPSLENTMSRKRSGSKSDEASAKTKDPSGGTTGRVKLYGRWGGWALAPDTASLGRDDRSHIE